MEREVERLHALVDAASRKRIVLHPDPRLVWSDADLGQRRELVRLLVERVDVMPARRGARFDPSRVRLTIPFAAFSPHDFPESPRKARVTPACCFQATQALQRFPVVSVGCVIGAADSRRVVTENCGSSRG